jgi:PEP-CTERM motif
MDIVNGRSNALAGIIGAGILCGALACGPARAGSVTDAFAFGGTWYSQDYAQLILQVGSQSITLSDGGFQGWVSGETFNFSGPDPVNTSYLAGVYGGSARNNFFVFNLAGVNPNATVTSAKLALYSGTISSQLNYSLYGATEAIGELSGGADSPNPALYDQLGTGTKYASVNISTLNSLDNLMLTLNASAVSEINSIIRAKKVQFAISGHAAAVPEPSTWIMMLAGFAGLGLAARRRAARGGRAVSAG